jgi:hypothetical protein
LTPSGYVSIISETVQPESPEASPTGQVPAEDVKQPSVTPDIVGGEKPYNEQASTETKPEARPNFGKTLKDYLKATFTNTPVQSPEQSWEEIPVMFGELVVEQSIKDNTNALFKQNATRLLIEYGFKEDSFMYDFGQAKLRLEEFVSSNPKGYGGILTLGDITGKKYYVYVKEAQL